MRSACIKGRLVGGACVKNISARNAGIKGAFVENVFAFILRWF